MTVPDESSTSHFELLEARAETLIRQGSRQAFQEASAAREEGERLGNELLMARADSLLGSIYLQRSEPDRAGALLSWAELVCRRHHDISGLMRCLISMSQLAYLRGEYDLSSGRLQELLKLAEARGDTQYISDAHNGLAIVYDTLGDASQALDHQLESIRALRSLPDPPGLAGLLSNVSADYRKLGNSAEAERYCNEAIILARRHAAPRTEANALYNLGLTYLSQQRPGLALESFAQTVALARSLHMVMPLSLGLRGLGRAWLALSQPHTALVPLQEALELIQRSNIRSEEAEIWLLLGRAQWGRQAIDSLHQALRVARETGLGEIEVEALQALSTAHEAAGDTAAALRELQAYVQISSQRQTQQLIQRAQVLAARFSSEETRRENLRLSARARDLEETTRRDPLTGLVNRRGLETLLEEAIERTRQTGTPLCVAMLDIDHFKQVNDRFSHRVGDDVLRACAALFRSSCRGGDEVARVGGEEFVLLLPDATLDAAASVLDRLRLNVQHHPWSTLAAGLQVTVSAGVVQATQTSSAESLLAAADQRLYQAKHSGRNLVVWA